MKKKTAMYLINSLIDGGEQEINVQVRYKGLFSWRYLCAKKVKGGKVVIFSKRG